jgi:hypothetical protein
MNRIINPEEAHRRLKRALQTLHLAHRWLQHARSDIVPDLALEQIEPVPEQRTFRVSRGRILPRVVVGAQLRDEFSAVLGGVDGEGLGDGQQGVSELGDGELFAGTL